MIKLSNLISTSGTYRGVANELGGYVVPVIGYEENDDQYIVLLAQDAGGPDNEDLDMTKFTAGQTVLLSLAPEIKETDEQTQEQTSSYTLTAAVIDSVDSTNCKLYLRESLYRGDVTSYTQIGYERVTVSGYTGTATGGPSAYRVTLSGAGTNDALLTGRRLYTRAGNGALIANTVAGTSGNYLYLGSPAAGTTAIYLGPSTVFISNKDRGEEDDSLLAAGEYNIVAGEASFAAGGYNTVVGARARA